MKVALFWNNISVEEFILASAVLSCLRRRSDIYFKTLYAVGLFPERTFLPTGQSNANSDIIDYVPAEATCSPVFEAVLKYARKRDCAFAMLSYGPAWVLDPVKLHELLARTDVQNKAISVRAGRITGKGMVFSAKFPYIDEHFIILNVQRCSELGIIEKCSLLNSRSHFVDDGGIHATLLSFLETVVPYGDVHVYADGNDYQDIFGDFKAFSVSPYHYSDVYGFVSARPDLDARVHRLRAGLLKDRTIMDTAVTRRYVEQHRSDALRGLRYNGGALFIKKALNRRGVEWVIRQAKRSVNRINYEVRKKYAR